MKQMRESENSAIKNTLISYILIGLEFISGQCSQFMSPEITRKPKVVFSGGIKWKHCTEMG